VKFESLRKCNLQDAASQLLGSHRQIAAMILSYLPRKRAAQLLSYMPTEVNSDLVNRIATMNGLNEEYVDIVDKMFTIKPKTNPGGVSAAAQLIKLMDPNIARITMDNVEKGNPNLHQAICEAENLENISVNLNGSAYDLPDN
jgi:flagellar motor switch protein FliG